jgi:hypothetical protein
MNKRTVALLGALLVFVAACGDGAGDTTTTEPPTTTVPDDGSVVAEFETPDGETYRIRLEGDAAQVAKSGTPGTHIGIPIGYIERGDGGVNIGHDWHMVDVEFADMTIELCDGTVSYIDDLGYDEFVSQHGNQFCPWGAVFVGIVD